MFDHTVPDYLKGSPWSRVEDDYLCSCDYLPATGSTLFDAYAYTKCALEDGTHGSTVTLAVAAPVTDAQGVPTPDRHWRVCLDSVNLDDAKVSDIAWFLGALDCDTMQDFKSKCCGTVNGREVMPWQQSLGEFLLRARLEDGTAEWVECPSPESARSVLGMFLGAVIPEGEFDHLDPKSPECSYPAAREAYDLSLESRDVLAASAHVSRPDAPTHEKAPAL